MAATESPMVIKALAPWFGAKRTLAAEIVRQLGKHRTYWEPFCGSMAVLLAKPTCSMETVNDLHSDLVNLARVIQDPVMGPRLYRMLRRTIFAKPVHTESRIETELDFEPGLQRAYWYFITSWFGRNGTSGTPQHNNNFCVRFTGKGGSPSSRMHSAVASLPAWRRRLRRVIVLQEDAFEILQRIEDEDSTAIYCDPPYLVKGAKYVHDFSAKAQGVGLFGDQHDRLALALQRFKRARVVVSYYEHPRLADLYPGWNRVTIDVSKALANQGARGKRDARAQEVLLVNGEVFGEEA